MKSNFTAPFFCCSSFDILYTEGPCSAPQCKISVIGGENMRIVVIDVQSTLVASAFERIFVQETADCKPVISETPEKTVEQCRLFKPGVLFVSDYQSIVNEALCG